MKKTEQEMFVSQHDLDVEIDKLRQAIRTANDAYTRLHDCVDLFNLPSPLDLTTDWLHFYISSRTEAVGKNICFDTEAKTRMIEGWKKIEKKVLPDVKTVERFCKSYKGLIRYDQNTLKVSFTDIDGLAISRTERPLPPEYYQHYNLIEKLRSGVRELRTWEKAHRCHKIALERLITSNQDDFKSMWANGSIIIDDANEESRDKWLRLAAEQLIF